MWAPYALLLLCMCVTLSGCSIRMSRTSSESGSQGTATMAAIDDMSIGERPMDVASFNAQIEASADLEAWVRSPSEVAKRFIGNRYGAESLSDTSSGRALGIEVSYQTGEENKLFVTSHARVTVTNDGLADDSIRGFRYRLEMTFVEPGAWRLLEAYESWRCWPGRGHQNYQAEPCQ